MKMNMKKIRKAIAVVTSVATVACCGLAMQMSASADLSWATINVYANRYYLNYNPYYSAYSGPDCTNYASQLLKVGGANTSGGPGSNSKINGSGSETTKSEWYFVKVIDKNSNMVSRWSSTWTVVENWRGIAFTQVGMNPYLKKKVTYRNRVKWSTDWVTKYGIKAGDVIQIDDNNDGTCEHTVVVQHVNGNTIYFTGHTNDRLMYNFANIATSSARYTIFHTSAGF